MEKHTIAYQGKDIEFEVLRKNVKNVNLNIRPDMSIVVSANPKVPLEFIKDFVKQKSPWILKSIKYFKEVQPEQYNGKEYVSGETFKYLGRQYRLKVEEAEQESIKYQRGFILLQVQDKTDFKIKRILVQKWFREKAVVNFHESLDRVYPLLEKYGVKKPEIKIRDMKSRWGSCNRAKGIITLNLKLVNAPKYCIDYVILHELVHFKYRNHDNNFYNFLTSLMPDWKQRKEILDEEVVRGL
ncbi:M48 family metallopeptidase [Desulfitibacter alkalitolerans]|uniref:M48 family metallopeptidase n=1 Tax=Desulfitibacter alkalitolerans TaxID=264641 RepID=UPI000482E747|nr:SprT family zinc-dependent metalloprotease [Desulfitibacter alkalitolerans]